MHDASFDGKGREAIDGRRCLWALHLAALAAVLLAASTGAQIPGTPTLQNAWAAPGGVVAFNFGGGPEGQTYAAALSFAPSSGKLMFAGGYGWRNGSGTTQNGVYGLRLAFPFGRATGSFGYAAFAGVGGGPEVTARDTLSSTTLIPIGVSIGWRRFFGGSQGISIYATPNYVFYSGGTSNDGLMRVGIGTDIGISPALGVTLGVDFGGTRHATLGGPSGVLYGLGVSYAFRRR